MNSAFICKKKNNVSLLSKVTPSQFESSFSKSVQKFTVSSDLNICCFPVILDCLLDKTGYFETSTAESIVGQSLESWSVDVQ